MELREDIQIGIGSGHAKKGASAIRRALDSIQRKSKKVHSSGARDARKHSKALGLVAKATAAISGLIIARSLIKSQIDFGQAVSDLSAITGAVGKDLDFLREKSKQFGAQTTLTATEAAEAFKVIASAKPDLLENVEALAAVTEEAIALAEATGESLPAAANVMASALNQFGEGADQASRFINVLAAGSKRGAALVGEMGEALKFAGIIASQAGLSFEETNAALQLMSTRALKGGEAGTQFRGVLLSLTAQSRDEFKPEVVGLQAALENLATAGLDDGSKALKLFGRRNLAAAKTLIQNRDQLGELTEKLTGTNVAYEQQAIRVDNLSGDIKALKSAYEGLELTIGAELTGSLRAMTKAATASIRAMAANPLLKKRTAAVLDTIHRIIQDIGLAWDQVTTAVTKLGGGAAVFEGVWAAAIQNIVKWTKFLWEQFVIGGPANIKLGITLMIAGFDLLKIGLIEKVRLIVFLMIERFVTFQKRFTVGMKVAVQVVIKTFVGMGQSIARVFDTMKLTIAGVIDSLILQVAEKVTAIANTLENLGFDKRAAEVRDVSAAIAGLATNEEAARKQVEANEVARKAEIAVIDAKIKSIRKTATAEIKASREITDSLIKDTEKVAAVQRKASLDAAQLAIMERDATLEQIKALRTKRAEILAGGAAAAAEVINPLAQVPLEAAQAYKDLGDTQKLIVDGMSDGIADMAAQGKADFKSLAASIIQDLIRIQLQTLLTDIFSTLLGGLGKGADAQPISTGGGAGSPASLTGVLSGAHGVTAKVRGSGGTDSQRILINATPGEVIQIRTPEQQRNEEGGGNVTEVKFVINNFSDSKVEAKRSQDSDGNLLIEATISAVARDISRNGEVVQALRARNTLQRR